MVGILILATILHLKAILDRVQPGRTQTRTFSFEWENDDACNINNHDMLYNIPSIYENARGC